MADSLKDKLINILIDGKLITHEQLDTALGVQKKIGGSLGKILIWQGYVSQEDIAIAMSRQLNIPPINLSKCQIDRSLIELIPERMVKQYLVMPVSKIGGVLTIAMADPLNIFAMDDIKMLTHYHIQPVIATEDDIKQAISSYYGSGVADISGMLELSEASDVTEIEKVEDGERVDVGEIAEESNKAPIVKVVNLILNEAMKARASDIHIEPRERTLVVRYRVDGNLQDALILPKKDQNAVIARLKIMSKLDITETRVPQDGRFKISIKGKEIDFRVSVLPVTFGGKIVLRALDKSNLTIGLDKLGFLPGPLSVFKAALARPYGLILVTGPTGSGKSTTLYSIITQINTPGKNIITLEDPVEYEIDGITQIQANADIGLTFANGLKSVLRQSPDIVMVGEIRDFETADISIKASLTGQLILSTLHTNDAAGAITRLIDMGVEPFLIASSLALSSAQRLMRRICPYCKEEFDVPKDVLKKAGMDPDKIFKDGFRRPYRGRGCERCNKTGYHGRFGILEAVSIDDNVRRMIMGRSSSDEIKNYAIKEQHMLTLRDNATENFLSGVTTLEEVLRATSVDYMEGPIWQALNM